MNSTLVVLDTNVFIRQPEVLLQLSDANVGLSLEVLRELDRLKASGGSAAYAARRAIKTLSEVLVVDNEMARGSFVYRVPSSEGVLITLLPQLEGVSDISGDDLILEELLAYADSEDALDVVFYTHDLNFRMRAMLDGLECADEKTLQDLGVHISEEDIESDGLLEVKDDFWGDFDGASEGKGYSLYPPQHYLDQITVGSFIKDSQKIYRVVECVREEGRVVLQVIKRNPVDGIEARDDRQRCALDALACDDIELVVLSGAAGCGKSLLAVAAAMKAINSDNTHDSLIVLKNKPPIVEEDGFLPGDLQDKMVPFIPGITDALVELGYDPEELLGEGVIEMRSINTIRGASWRGKFVIIEEGQNLTAKAMKAILTRLGEGSKVVITGNIVSSQIDAVNVSASSCGMARVIEAFSEHELASHVQLQSMYRNGIAAHAERAL
ncbi:PhoH family protein [Vibrio breoganii]|uniref:PhoH family protein n=3 Tax=Vibrio TaxID=662 RepID=UPI000C85A45A|nr:PhoH family protein [Vibrio breoganii]PML12809.1 hypothetical protein BCT84_02685 [Vibrio breoganii]